MSCLACQSDTVAGVSALTSEFLSARAWGGAPERTLLQACIDCGFRWFERRLSGDEAARYYAGYRDEVYERDRARAEWFYTKSLHATVGEWSGSDRRAAHIRGALARMGLTSFPIALDYGGGNSGMLRELETGRAVTYDVDGKPIAVADGACDLVVCAHVLEHCSEPVAEVQRIAGLLKPGGVLYLELPDQLWKDSFASSWLRERFIGLALRSPFALKVLDFIFTGIRVAFRRLPSFAFVAEREHINYFSAASMRQLVSRAGLSVVAEGLGVESSDGPSMWLLARKPGGAS